LVSACSPALSSPDLATIARLASVGIDAHGEVGDGDPLVAVDDAVRTFSPHEIVISTHPPGRSNWLEGGGRASVRPRYDVPVTHVVVDLGSEPGVDEGSTTTPVA